MAFSDIIGQKELKERLGKTIGQVSARSFLFTGPEGIGKHTIGRELARAFLCEDPGADGSCGKCPSCTYFNAGTHPDMKYFETDEGKKTLSVATMREKLIPDTAIAPQISKKKVYMVNMDNIEIKYQNLLLKVLEEPPAGVVFILLCTDSANVLPTILSRASEYKISPYSDDETFEILKSNDGEGLPEDKLRFIATFSAGIPGKGMTLLEDETFNEEREEVFSFLTGIPEKGYTDLLYDDYALFDKEQDKMEEILLIMMWFLGDMAALLSSAHPDNIKNRDKTSEIKAFLAKNKGITLINMSNAAQAVTDLNRDIRSRVSFESACCGMLLKLKKEFGGK